MINFFHKNQIRGIDQCGQKIIIVACLANQQDLPIRQRAFVNHVMVNNTDQRILFVFLNLSIVGISRTSLLICRNGSGMRFISQETENPYCCVIIIDAQNVESLGFLNLLFTTKMVTVEAAQIQIILWITWLLYVEAAMQNYTIRFINGPEIMNPVLSVAGLTFVIMQRAFASTVMRQKHTERNSDDIVRSVWKHTESNRKRVARNTMEIEKALAGHNNPDGGGLTTRIMGQLLTWRAETKAPVMLVATANNVEALPPELLRKGRFDEIWAVGLPVFSERVEIFAIHLKKRNRNPENFNLDILAANSVGFVGSEIESSIEDAMYSAFFEDREFTTQDILQSLKSTVSQAVSQKEAIEKILKWAKGRARLVSSATEDDSPKPKSGRSLRLMKSKGE